MASANYFEITGLDDTVRSIHFTPQLNDPAAAAKATDSKLQVVMYLQDEGNANYYQLPAVSVDPKDAASTYISLDRRATPSSTFPDHEPGRRGPVDRDGNRAEPAGAA